MSDVRELLPLYALGALEPDEAEAVERAVDADPTLAAELDAYLDLVPAVEPAPDVKARLLASVGGGRFEKFADRMAKLLDVTVDRARELLALIERPASWFTDPRIPGVTLIHFEGGPACAAADCGFVRIAPGCTFPWHTHLGEEVAVILSGEMRDHDGNVMRAGDEMRHPQAHHDQLTAGDEGVLYVTRAINGIELGPPR